MAANLFGYDGGDTWVHRLGGATKLIAFLGISLIGMISYDARFTGGVVLLSLLLFGQARIRWSQVRLVVRIVAVFAVLNLLAVWVFSPEYGVALYGTRHLIAGVGRFTITWEQLFYELNMALKYVVMVPLALVLLITTSPSEFASSLNKVGVPYRGAYAVALSLRYIPDVQDEFLQISLAQQARGHELSAKAPLRERLTGSTRILLPLIFSSLERIETVSRAMELRRFGRRKRRTWYSARPMRWQDWAVLAGTAVIIAVGVWLMHVDGGRFWNPFV